MDRPRNATPLIDRACDFATRAHAGQNRKDGAGPYIVHPARVAQRLAERFPQDHALCAAAWCHDILEDCPRITHDDLRAAIGDDAYGIVTEVTNVSKQHAHLPRAERKAMDRARIATISDRAKCLKLADRADNMWDTARSATNARWIMIYTQESHQLALLLRGVDAELEQELAIAIAAAEERGRAIRNAA